jgi:hypothetical protein
MRANPSAPKAQNELFIRPIVIGVTGAQSVVSLEAVFFSRSPDGSSIRTIDGFIPYTLSLLKARMRPLFLS